MTSLLPSCEIDEQFNRKNEDYSLSEECKKLEGMITNYEGIYDFCKKLERNLKDLCIKANSDGFLYYRVEYLYYWLMDQAIQTFNITNNGKFSGINSRFHKTWNNIIATLASKDFLCKPLTHNHYILTIDKFKYMKEIYSYYFNYKYIEMNKITDENECTVFCEYLSSMRIKFIELKKWCSFSSNKCLIDMKSFEKCDPENLLKKLGCGKKDLCFKLSVQYSARENSDGINSSSESSLSDLTISGPTTSAKDFETSTTAVTVTLPLLGILAICLILFKITPLGSWIYNSTMKKIKIIEHLNEKERHKLLDDYIIS
ncbi:PIR Superfamily Protein [Plasmodium ovale wallikeri]|uniref:PIR Superfamily Protein n=1 Tax=Plasmodium ovale wallikeri TaxID=864142 RepID=A0A1A9AN00_PLAOA|nr:PIR Superfamily Protein [Plasmodium ovale wallikeri]SBT58048.1 PIR Superfamily Protein [Plasmodium ovale wallikeri]